MRPKADLLQLKLVRIRQILAAAKYTPSFVTYGLLGQITSKHYRGSGDEYRDLCEPIEVAQPEQALALRYAETAEPRFARRTGPDDAVQVAREA
jgi:hypothetical protein